MAIETLAYTIVADTNQFVTGVTATKKELQFMKGAMLETATPTERLQMKLDALGKLFAEGKMQLGAYTQAVDRLKAEFEKTEKAASGIDTVLGRIVPTFDLATVATKAFGAAQGMLSSIVASVVEQVEKVDKIWDVSQNIGMDPNQFMAFQLAAERMGSSSETATDALRTMLRVVGDADEGSKKAADALTALGLSASELKGLNPEDMFMRIAAEINKLPTAAERADAAQEIFKSGITDLGQLLGLTGGKLAEFRQKLEAAGQTMGKESWESMEQAKDAAGDAALAWEGLIRNIAAATAENRKYWAELAQHTVEFSQGKRYGYSFLNRERPEIQEALRIREEAGRIAKERSAERAAKAEAAAQREQDLRDVLGTTEGHELGGKYGEAASADEIAREREKQLKDAEDAMKAAESARDKTTADWLKREKEADKELREVEKKMHDESLKRWERFNDARVKALEAIESPAKTFAREVAELGPAANRLDIEAARFKMLQAQFRTDSQRRTSTTALMGGSREAFSTIVESGAVMEELQRKQRIAAAIAGAGGMIAKPDALKLEAEEKKAHDNEMRRLLQLIEQNTREGTVVNEVDSLEPSIA